MTNITPEALIKRSRPQYGVNHLLLMYTGAGKSKDIDAIDFTLAKYGNMPLQVQRRSSIIEQGKIEKDSNKRILNHTSRKNNNVDLEYHLQSDYESVGKDTYYHVPRSLQELSGDINPSGAAYAKLKVHHPLRSLGNSEKRIDAMAAELPMLKTRGGNNKRA